MSNLIIGITGTLGAGKGTVVEYLKEKFEFDHYSASEFITHEIINRKMPINRDSMRIVADDLREKNSPSYVIDSLYNMAIIHKSNAVIESIRCPGEITSLKQKQGFILISVDTTPKIRYERILMRKSSKDDISYEKFLEQENSESNNKEEFKMNLPFCILQADYHLNNGGSFQDLYDQIDEVMEKIQK